MAAVCEPPPRVVPGSPGEVQHDPRGQGLRDGLQIERVDTTDLAALIAEDRVQAERAITVVDHEAELRECGDARDTGVDVLPQLCQLLHVDPDRGDGHTEHLAGVRRREPFARGHGAQRGLDLPACLIVVPDFASCPLEPVQFPIVRRGGR